MTALREPVTTVDLNSDPKVPVTLVVLITLIAVQKRCVRGSRTNRGFGTGVEKDQKTKEIVRDDDPEVVRSRSFDSRERTLVRNSFLVVPQPTLI